MGHSCRALLWDQVSKTSVSYETSSKSHTSSLQNERLVRDVLKNSPWKVCKTSVSYETCSKSQAETPIGAHTSRSPAKQFRDSSPSKQQSNNIRSHANANLRRDDDDKRRETTTNDDRRRDDARHANIAPTPRPPTINGNPSLRIREKTKNHGSQTVPGTNSWNTHENDPSI